MGSEILQGSDEWKRQRAGLITCSRLGDLMAKIKTGESASRENYIAQIVSEILTGIPQDSFSSEAMKHGIETEAEAREFYESETFNKVEQVGFKISGIPRFGGSVDGLIGDKGILEIKCPNTATHLKLLQGGSIPKKYILQMHGYMFCWQRDYCIFLDYDNRMPVEYRAYIKQIDRDEKIIAEIKEEVLKGLEDIDKILENLKNYKIGV